MERSCVAVDPAATFRPLRIALLTVSDTRTPADDLSGDALAERIAAAGHTIAERRIAIDSVDEILSDLHRWIDDPAVDVVITTGGTGLTGRDVTPEALAVVESKAIPGFGELFRALSYRTIGSAAMLSRATAVLARGTYIFALPGSTGACRDAWDMILRDQLDYRFRPCNFVELLPRLREHERRAAS